MASSALLILTAGSHQCPLRTALVLRGPNKTDLQGLIACLSLSPRSLSRSVALLLSHSLSLSHSHSHSLSLSLYIRPTYTIHIHTEIHFNCSFVDPAEAST